MPSLNFLLRVREGGVEPPCPHGHTDLNRARLPIPPLALTSPKGDYATIQNPPLHPSNCALIQQLNTPQSVAFAAIRIETE